MAERGNGQSLNDKPRLSSLQLDPKRRFVLACIDQVLSSLGPDVRRALTYYMRREYSLKHYEIPDKPREFSLALRHVFGRSSDRIEREIVMKIVDGLHLQKRQLSFEDAVRAALA